MLAPTAVVCALQLSMHEQFPSYMETTLQLATNQGVVLPPRSSAAKSVLSTVGGAADEEVAEMASSSNTHGTGAAALTSACRGAVPHSMLAWTRAWLVLVGAWSHETCGT